MKRLVTVLLAAAALSACAADPATTESSPLARAGHPSGFRYAAASSVKSGSCTVASASPELLAFGCPSDAGTFVEYSPARELDHCAVFNQWAATHGASGTCHDKDGSVHVEAKFDIDGHPIHAELHHGRLRVTHVTAADTNAETTQESSSAHSSEDSTHGGTMPDETMPGEDTTEDSHADGM